eukprot:s1280_g2.t1
MGWFSDVLAVANDCDRSWWHVYLDNYCGGERIETHSTAVAGALCHDAAENAWKAAGVVSSEKKKVVAANYIQELGAEVDGDKGILGVSVDKLQRMAIATLWLLAQSRLTKKNTQIITGRWVFALQFRRPAMGFLQDVWQITAGSKPGKLKLDERAKGEIWGLLLALPLLHCNLCAGIAKHVVCTDASEKAGAVGYAETLTDQGRDFVRASQKLHQPEDGLKIPVLVLSLFNGVGGAFRCYDVLSLSPTARVAVEIDPGANRISARRWPGTLFAKDIKHIDRQMVQEWSRKLLDVAEIHIWAGFPCTDLSSVKWGRQNLKGPNSSLFWEVPRVERLVKEEFGSTVVVKHVYENVASIDKNACQDISETLQKRPYYLNCEQAVPMKRPRLSWTTQKIEGCMPGVQVTDKGVWKEVWAPAPYPDTSQWIRPVMVVYLLAGRTSRAERARRRAKIVLDDAALSDKTQARYYSALRKLLPYLEACRHRADLLK